MLDPRLLDRYAFEDDKFYESNYTLARMTRSTIPPLQITIFSYH